VILCLRPKPRQTAASGPSKPSGLGLARCLGAAFLVAALIASAQAQNSVTLAWDPSPSGEIAGYRVYEGTASQDYTTVIDVGNVTTKTVTDLVSGTTYFFAFTAYDIFDQESGFSTEISYTVPWSAKDVPSIALTSPTDGADYAAPATINLVASVVAKGHTITRVEFYNGATLLGAVGSAPYSVSWNNKNTGTCSLSAKAVYDSGSTVASVPVNVNVSVSVAQPRTGLTFAADSQSVSAPFAANNGTLFQSLQTGVTNGGRAAYTFNIVTAGNYLVSALVSAPSQAQNSFCVNIDAEPTDPLMIWDIPVCSELTSHTVSWRGNGNGDPASSQYSPKVFTLSAGMHQLIIRGREANTRLSTISIAPAPPVLQIHAAPGGSVILSGTGEAGQKYNVLCSQDLKVWTVMGAVTIDDGGSFQFTDPAASSRPKSFYRLQTLVVMPPKLQIRASAGGPVTLSGTGQAGQMYNVLCSPDLKVWTVLGVVTINAGGSFQFIDPAGTSLPKRFYRLQSIAVTAPTLQIRASAGGPATLTGTGQAGQTYNVQYSQDLKVWTVIGAVTIDTGGSFKFTDPAAATRPIGLYRLQGQ
jgi:hypothetical protein